MITTMTVCEIFVTKIRKLSRKFSQKNFAKNLSRKLRLIEIFVKNFRKKNTKFRENCDTLRKSFRFRESYKNIFVSTLVIMFLDFEYNTLNHKFLLSNMNYVQYTVEQNVHSPSQ
jgi:hypothetical protein